VKKKSDTQGKEISPLSSKNRERKKKKGKRNPFQREAVKGLSGAIEDGRTFPGKRPKVEKFWH